MDRVHTVKKSSDFSYIIHNCSFVKNKSYVIYYNKESGLDCYRFGISVSKKLGKAVYRNKYKRQLRFIIDKYKKYYQNGYDYIIILKKDFPQSNFEGKCDLFIDLINKLNNHISKE